MTPLEAIEKLSGQPVLVLGDMIADIYLYGTIARISREAPVLVLEQSTEKIVAGGEIASADIEGNRPVGVAHYLMDAVLLVGDTLPQRKLGNLSNLWVMNVRKLRMLPHIHQSLVVV